MRSNGVADPVAFEDSIELLRRQAADPYFSLPRMSSTSLAPISVPSTTSIGRRPSSIMCGRNKKALASSSLPQTSRAKVQTFASRTRRSLSSAESLSCRFFRRASVALDTMRCLKFMSLGATNRQRCSSAASGNPFSIRSMNSNGEAGRLPRCLSPRTAAISSKPGIGEAPYHVRHNIVSHDTGINPPVLGMPLRPPCLREALERRAPSPFETRCCAPLLRVRSSRRPLSWALHPSRRALRALLILRDAPSGRSSACALRDARCRGLLILRDAPCGRSSSLETRPPGAPQDEAALCVAFAIYPHPEERSEGPRLEGSP